MADRKLAAFAWLAAAASVAMLGDGVTASLMPGHVIRLSGRTDLVWLISSSFALPYIFLQLPIGSQADRRGFKPFFLLSYLLLVICALIYTFTDSCTLIFAGRAIQGAGEIAVWALAPPLISMAYPESKGKMIGIYTACTYLALSAGPLLVSYCHDFFGDRGGFLLFAACGAAAFFIILFAIPGERPANTGEYKGVQFRGILAVTGNFQARTVMFGTFLYGCEQGLIFSIAPGWLISAKAYSASDMGILFSAYYFCTVAAQFVFGPLSDRYGRKLFMVLGLVGTALAWGGFPYVSKIPATALLGMTSGFMSGFFVASMAFMNDTTPDSLKGTVSGAYYLVWGIGYFLGPILWGFGGKEFGMTRAFAVFSILLIATAAMVVISHRESAGCVR